MFLVPIRDKDTFEPLPGVTIGDCGPKIGVEGIDNGFCLFNNYRVPYNALLDRFAQISDDGKYKTPIKSKEKRFAAMFAGLIRGRCAVMGGSAIAVHKVMQIAIRYGAVRRQFSAGGSEECNILDYPLHRYRLMPHLARGFGLAKLMEWFLSLYAETRPLIRANPECI